MASVDQMISDLFAFLDALHENVSNDDDSQHVDAHQVRWRPRGGPRRAFILREHLKFYCSTLTCVPSYREEKNTSISIGANTPLSPHPCRDLTALRRPYSFSSPDTRAY